MRASAPSSQRITGIFQTSGSCRLERRHGRHATVVRSPGSSLTGEEIAAFAREHLASYKVPRSVDFTDELPRTGSGKLLKRQLRAAYWAGRTAQIG